MLLVVDYGMGNIGSILNMLRKIGTDAGVARTPEEVLRADKLILPGVGAFDRGMANLHELDLVRALEQKVLEEGAPLLGICLGMQLLTHNSEEGVTDGLGWIPAQTVRLDESQRIPHMGWNMVSPTRSHPILAGFSDPPRFYFVHSYRVECESEDVVLGKTSYGEDFVSVVGRKNVFGTQFHPEKSHRYGMTLLRNFAELVP